MWQVVERPIPFEEKHIFDAKVEFGGLPLGYSPPGFPGEEIRGFSFYEVLPEHDPETGKRKCFYIRFIRSSFLNVPTYYVKHKSGLEYWSTREIIAMPVWFVWENDAPRKRGATC